MKVYIQNKQKELAIDKKKVRLIAEEVVRFEKRSYQETSIHFVTVRMICRLHDAYFNDPSQTDCISFPMENLESEEYKIMGDIFICPKTAIEYAAKHNSDPYKETTLYIVHGLLHLMGYNDIERVDRKKMRAAERRHMKNLESKGLLLNNSET